MTPEQLKASILQYAIQGKLVEQRPEEGTGEELYRHIQAEKQRLIKEGKIKKEKALPKIAEDEIPFDLPDSWRWVRLSQLVSVLNGDRGKNYPAKSTLSHKGIPFISALNLDGKSVIEDDNLLCLSEQQYERLGNGKLIRDDIVVCIRGSLGKHGRYPFDKGAIASSLVILRPFMNEAVMAEFLMMYLDTPLFFSEIRRYDNGTAQPNLAAKSLEQFLLPLPPLAEQQRIVAKIEELLPYVDCYAAAYEKLEQFNAKFPEDMKKSILQYAIQGKLVEQRPEEGTGEDIFKQLKPYHKGIKPCKDELNFSSMDFDIPESWTMVELNQIFDFVDYRGKTPTKITSGVFLITASNIKQGYMDYTRKEYISFEEYKGRQSRGLTQKGDLIFTTEAPMGNVALCDLDECSCGQRIITFKEYTKEATLPALFMYFILSPQFQQQLLDNCTGTTAKGIKAEKLKHFLLPLPPYEEQKRIVAKLEEILPLCERLK